MTIETQKWHETSIAVNRNENGYCEKYRRKYESEISAAAAWAKTEAAAGGELSAAKWRGWLRGENAKMASSA